MAVRYLKKKRLYDLAKSLLESVVGVVELPLVKNCEYQFYRGSEWLGMGDYYISTMGGGSWCEVEIYKYSENDSILNRERHIFSKWNGKEYKYHSVSTQCVEVF